LGNSLSLYARTPGRGRSGSSVPGLDGQEESVVGAHLWHDDAMARLPPEVSITPRLSVSTHEFEFSYARSGGPGGQHVNKTSSKVLLRWNFERSGALTPAQRDRVRAKLGARATEDGDILVTSELHREQSRNVDDAVQKFAAILQEALRVPKKRRATRPTRGSQKRRMDSKRKRGDTKKQRGSRPQRDD
jgi:ribosome-associated protein